MTTSLRGGWGAASASLATAGSVGAGDLARTIRWTGFGGGFAGGSGTTISTSGSVSANATVTGLVLAATSADQSDGVSDLLALTHSSSNNDATNGDGIGVTFDLENDADTVEEWAAIDVLSTDISDGAEDGDFVFSQMLAGTVTESMRLDSSAQALIVGRNATDANGMNAVRIYANTATNGYLELAATASGGDFWMQVTNATIGQNSTITIPDPGGASDSVGLLGIANAWTGANTHAGAETFASIDGNDAVLAIAGTAGAAAGAGGVVTIAAGNGHTAAAGGLISIASGTGADTGAGGLISIAGGASGSGATGNGGAATFGGGAAASTNGDGGDTAINGGAGKGTGTGGDVTITSGASEGAAGTAGAITIDSGDEATGTAGAITIGATEAASVAIGRTAITTTLNGALKSEETNSYVLHSAVVDLSAAAIQGTGTLISVPAGRQFKLVNLIQIAIGGSAATATSVDISVNGGATLVSTTVGALTQSTVVQLDTANVTVLADAASFAAGAAGANIEVDDVGGGALDGLTSMRFIVSYQLI